MFIFKNYILRCWWSVVQCNQWIGTVSDLYLMHDFSCSLNNCLRNCLHVFLVNISVWWCDFELKGFCFEIEKKCKVNLIQFVLFCYCMKRCLGLALTVNMQMKLEKCLMWLLLLFLKSCKVQFLILIHIILLVCSEWWGKAWSSNYHVYTVLPGKHVCWWRVRHGQQHWKCQQLWLTSPNTATQVSHNQSELGL